MPKYQSERLAVVNGTIPLEQGSKFRFDCPECHAEKENHQLLKTVELVFGCKKCKKVFRKDASDFDESDEFCPHCDNQFVIEAKTPEMAVGFEADDPRLNNRLFKDPRMKSTVSSIDGI